jgi:copper transporter 1
MLQMTLAYLAMLVVMTYDSGLFLALVAGFGVGYLCFKSSVSMSQHEVKNENEEEHNDARVKDQHVIAATWRFSDFQSLLIVHVPSMKCMANCGFTVEKTLLSIDGVRSVYIDMLDKIVYVSIPSISSSQVVDALDGIGFTGNVLRVPDREANNSVKLVDSLNIA